MSDLRTLVVVTTLPECDFCHEAGVARPARYDFATRFGPWAYGCEEHWRAYRAAARLGLGIGQMLMRSDEIPESAPER